MLWRSLKHVKQGFYIDVGANDPVQDSLTKAFYDRGWNGINIEPVTEWYKKLSAERQRDINLQIAAGNRNGELRLFEVAGTGLSTASEDYAQRHAQDQGYEVSEQIVPVRTLTDICEEQNVSEIHFLKVDVEGSEKSVLEGLDLTSVRPWIILVEATQPQTQILDHYQWEHLIVDNGYQFVYFDGLNRFYVADEHAKLASMFNAPPNPWDRYERFCDSTVVRQQYETLKAAYESLDAKRNFLEAQAGDLRKQLSSQTNNNHVLEAAIQELLSSRSMRVTAPLRGLLNLARNTKMLSKHLPRKIIRQALRKVIAQPRLRQMAKTLANKYPTFVYRISSLLHEEPASKLNDFMHLNQTDIPPRAVRILNDLRQVISETGD
ncbi:MAG: FkbM family methyltransferase [Phormidesmis sp.]